MIICEVCGNEFDRTMASCPFCGAVAKSIDVRSIGSLHRVVNLERGLPTVAQALARLEAELETAWRQKYRVLTFIHGYGSSGKGGAIKDAVRRQLEYYKHQGRINELITGENFSSRSGSGRQLLRRFPTLTTHSDLNRSNPGVTLVVL
jgi:hypothetical protein